jgi:hypothetical protein
MNIEPSNPIWPSPLRIGFRFVFSYLMLYLFNPTAETLLHSIPAYFGWGWSLPNSLAVPWAGVVRWTGERMLGLAMPYNWMDRICCALLAFVATIVWSWLDRRRPDYAGVHAFLRGAIRVYLVLSLFAYASVKVIPVQFGNLGPADWLLPFGEQLPRELLWRFMAASPGYTRLTGIVELIGVVLLLSPRTTLLGALVTAGALGNVIALDFWYQVDVLNTALHMFLMTLVLIAPDSVRLGNFFLLHRAVPVALFPPFFRRVGFERAFIVGKYGAFVFLASTILWRMHQGHCAQLTAEAAESLRGIWTVERQELNGQIMPPLLTDTNRWRHIIIERGQAIVQPMSGDSIRYKLDLTETNHSLLFRRFRLTSAPMFARGETDTNAPPAGTFEYEQAQPDTLMLHGSYAGKATRATLRQMDESKFRLTRRSVRWIPEHVDRQ